MLAAQSLAPDGEAFTLQLPIAADVSSGPTPSTATGIWMPTSMADEDHPPHAEAIGEHTEA
jgi:hypothetical protein